MIRLHCDIVYWIDANATIAMLTSTWNPRLDWPSYNILPANEWSFYLMSMRNWNWNVQFSQQLQEKSMHKRHSNKQTCFFPRLLRFRSSGFSMDATSSSSWRTIMHDCTCTIIILNRVLNSQHYEFIKVRNSTLQLSTITRWILSE